MQVNTMNVTSKTAHAARRGAAILGEVRRLGSGLGALLRLVAREREVRRAQLDDRLLADIGLARDQIERAVRTGRSGAR